MNCLIVPISQPHSKKKSALNTLSKKIFLKRKSRFMDKFIERAGKKIVRVQ